LAKDHLFWLNFILTTQLMPLNYIHAMNVTAITSNPGADSVLSVIVKPSLPDGEGFLLASSAVVAALTTWSK